MINEMREAFLPAYKVLLEEDRPAWGWCIAFIDRLTERSILELQPVADASPLVQCPFEMKELDLGTLVTIDTPEMLDLLIVHVLSADQAENDESYLRLLNAFTKSFEVRKRLYEQYTKEFKPLSANYRSVDNYAKFSFVLAVVYLKTNNLKYLNALLKINDTIASVSKEVNESPQSFTRVFLSLLMERYAVHKLCVTKGLSQ
ncbi:hypothetical protein [Cohnella yongneupensis]|uniref:Uncharacterized protein n=1 Tax=Cohnella yongneupensis TaxID=425006 RepID=A0ABW0QVU2_9BACL